MRYVGCGLLTVLVLFFGQAISWADNFEQPQAGYDWSGWQGPERNCLSRETGLLKSWPAKGPKVLWTTDQAGAGLGGMAVSQGRLFVLGTEGEKDCAIAFDAATGKKLWSTVIGEIWRDGFGVGPRSTPSTDGEFVIALGGQQANLVCLRADTGEIVWKKNYRKDFKSAWELDYGRCSESPLLDGDKVLCTPGGELGTMFALDKRTGKVLWHSEKIEECPTISSIVVAEICGVRQYIQRTDHNLFGVAEDGRLLWRYAHKKPQGLHIGIAIHTPMVFGDIVLANYGGNFSGSGDSQAFKLTRENGKFSYQEIYTTGDLSWNQHAIVDGYVYGGIMGAACLEFATGKKVPLEVDENIEGTISIIHADDRFYFLNGGIMSLIEATPEGATVHGNFSVGKKLKSEGFTAPALSNGRLYVRDMNLIYCYDVADPAANTAQKLRVRPAGFRKPAIDSPQPAVVQATVDPLGDPLPEKALARIGTLRFRPAEKDIPFSERFMRYASWIPNSRLAPDTLNKFDKSNGCAVLLPNGKEVVSVHRTGKVYVSDVDTGKELRSWNGPAEANNLVISADGKRLIAGGSEGIWAWDLSETPPRLLWKDGAHGDASLKILRFSPDEKTLAVGGGEPYLLDAATGTAIESFDSKGSGARLAFSHDGKLLAICHPGTSNWDEAKIDVYDLEKKSKREILDVGNCYFGFSPDSQALRFVGYVPWASYESEIDGSNIPARFQTFLGTWDITTGKENRKPLSDIPSRAFFVFTDGGKTLLELGCGRIRTLDAATGNELSSPVEFVDDYGDTSRNLSSDGKRMAYVNGTAVRVRDMKTGALLGLASEAPISAVQVAFSPDGKSLATSDKQSVQVWDAKTGQPRRQMQIGAAGAPAEPLSYLSHHPILGTTFNWVDRDNMHVANKIGFPTNDQVYGFTAPNRRISFAGWNSQTGAPLTPAVTPFGAGLPFYEFSRTGRFLAVAGDFEFTVYDLVTGKEVRTITDVEPIVLLTFSSDEKSVLVYSTSRRGSDEDGRIMNTEKDGRVMTVWDVASGNKIAELSGFLINCYDMPAIFVNTPAALSPGAKLYAATGKSRSGQDPEQVPDMIVVYEVESRKLVQEFDGPEKGITCICFSPDGRSLAGGCSDGTVRLWDLESGEETHCFSGHQGRVGSIAFSPDGSRLASGSDDSTALIWDLLAK